MLGTQADLSSVPNQKWRKTLFAWLVLFKSCETLSQETPCAYSDLSEQSSEVHSWSKIVPVRSLVPSQSSHSNEKSAWRPGPEHMLKSLQASKSFDVRGITLRSYSTCGPWSLGARGSSILQKYNEFTAHDRRNSSLYTYFFKIFEVMYQPFHCLSGKGDSCLTGHGNKRKHRDFYGFCHLLILFYELRL